MTDRDNRLIVEPVTTQDGRIVRVEAYGDLIVVSDGVDAVYSRSEVELLGEGDLRKGLEKVAGPYMESSPIIGTQRTFDVEIEHLKRNLAE